MLTVTIPGFGIEQQPMQHHAGEGIPPLRVSVRPLSPGTDDGGTVIGSDNHLAWGIQLGDGSSVSSTAGSGLTPRELSGVTGPGTVQRQRVTQSSMRPMSHLTVATQPTSQSVMAGQNAAFAAAASGLPGPKVQWQVSTDHGVTFFPVTGATSDTLNIPATTFAENGNEYEAVFTNRLPGRPRLTRPRSRSYLL